VEAKNCLCHCLARKTAKKKEFLSKSRALGSGTKGPALPGPWRQSWRSGLRCYTPLLRAAAEGLCQARSSGAIVRICWGAERRPDTRIGFPSCRLVERNREKKMKKGAGFLIDVKRTLALSRP
jgi:hypothetical protein